jgi:hypothetical protein
VGFGYGATWSSSSKLLVGAWGCAFGNHILKIFLQPKRVNGHWVTCFRNSQDFFFSFVKLEATVRCHGIRGINHCERLTPLVFLRPSVHGYPPKALHGFELLRQPFEAGQLMTLSSPTQHGCMVSHVFVNASVQKNVLGNANFPDVEARRPSRFGEALASVMILRRTSVWQALRREQSGSPSHVQCADKGLNNRVRPAKSSIGFCPIHRSTATLTAMAVVLF